MSILKKIRSKSALKKSPRQMETVASERTHELNPTQQPSQSESLISFANKCSGIAQSASAVQIQIATLQALHRRALQSVGASSNATNAEIEKLGAQIADEHKRLVADVQKLKTHTNAHSAQFAAHLGLAWNSVRDAMSRHAEVQGEYRQALREAAERQYRIVRPEASDEEVKLACEAEPESAQLQQIFAQELLRGDGKAAAAGSTLQRVEERHRAIWKAETQLAELEELFQVLAGKVAEQEQTVVESEDHATGTKENVEVANVDLNEATDKARAARSKKWKVFWICVALVVVIVVVAAIAISLA